MPRKVVQEVKDDIALIVTAFPAPAERTPVIEAYLAQRDRRNERIIEDV